MTDVRQRVDPRLLDLEPPTNADPATVSVLLPVLNEAAHIERCLRAIGAQSYADIVEILVIDGRSHDATRDLAAQFPGVRVIDNPRRIQAAALNIGIAEAKGDVLVRVDGHCEIAPDYIATCVEVLETQRAVMVGGGMTPQCNGGLMQRAIAGAMSSRLGAGPARFHVGGEAGPVDTVYLGAYRTADARAVGGYREDVGVNEDAEFALRMRDRGLCWYEPRIRSTYVPRANLKRVAIQFHRYGRSRAATVRLHPRSLAPRQLAAPALVLGLISPWRKLVLTAYGTAIAVRSISAARQDPAAAAGFGVVAPVMHLSWGTGFIRGLFTRR